MRNIINWPKNSVISNWWRKNLPLKIDTKFQKFSIFSKIKKHSPNKLKINPQPGFSGLFWSIISSLHRTPKLSHFREALASLHAKGEKQTKKNTEQNKI